MSNRPYVLPPVGGNPASAPNGTTPGSFANPARIGTAWAYSSPDTPGMPRPSPLNAQNTGTKPAKPLGSPRTQLEFARAGVITPEMQRIAQVEPHLSAEQVRAEVAAGRMVIWHNLLGDGTANPRFLHAATPVHAGAKTVLTTWSRQGTIRIPSGLA